MMSYIKPVNSKELSIMPSQFLNVVIDEKPTDSKKSKKKNEMLTTISSLSTSTKRTLESETTIIPIYKTSK